MVNFLVAENTSILEKEWAPRLARHGYNTAIKDLSSDGQWHGVYPNEIRDLGSITFWKEQNKDGVLIQKVKFYVDGESTTTMRGTGVFLIGKALEYFKQQGYNQKILEKSDKGFEVFNSMDFLDFLSK